MWQPYMFSKLLPNLGALQNHPSQQRPSTSRVRGVQLTFPLQNSDPVFQQGPPAPICVPWFPFVFFLSYPKTGVFGGRLPRGWVVLSGGSCGEKITMFLQEMDGFRILYVFWLVGWFCWGRWIACFFVRKFLEIETTADSFLVEDRIHFKPLWKGCLNPTKKRHILGGSSQEWSLLSPCWP